MARQPRNPDTVWRTIGLAAPARRALVNVGIMSFDDLSEWTQSGVMDLHGVGPNAMAALTKAMDEAGCSFAP